MKNDRLEIRISEEKKMMLKQYAKDMNVTISAIIDKAIDILFSNIREYSIMNNTEQLSKCFMLLYNKIDCIKEDDLRDDLLRIVEVMECLI